MNAGVMDREAAAAIAEIRRSGLRAPARILFGAGGLARAGALARELAGGRPALVLTCSALAAPAGAAARLGDDLRQQGVPVETVSGLDQEPTVAVVDAAAARARAIQPGLIVSLGGGSVMDCAKAVAALAVNAGSAAEYLEGLGHRTQLERPPLPHLAIPTTAGTGAEATRNAVIAAPGQGGKKSMRFDGLLPAAALLDPELTRSVPRAATAAGGLDTVTQLLEACISRKRTPAVTALAHRGLRLTRAALPVCCDHPGDLAARSAMLLASFLSGVCLANAGLALAHGLAAALGALHHVPHGLACGILLPATLRYNRTACAPALAAALAAFLYPDAPAPLTDDVVIDRGLAALEALQRRLGVPADLRHLKLDERALQRLAAMSMGNSMSGNPVPMDPERTLAFLRTL
ncbi:MAG: iron-containing alcohol dehydrogenase [Kiritimatiellaeota bacterium]|nr:iron-containing alcohol dehydrogenase [Kiritimatiellota bacterium]